MNDIKQPLFINQHLELLGKKVKDRVTGQSGVVTSISFDLYGCIQAIVHPGMDSAGKMHEMLWFDVNRLAITDPIPVMERPLFEWADHNIAAGHKGCENKPFNSRY